MTWLDETIWSRVDKRLHREVSSSGDQWKFCDILGHGINNFEDVKPSMSSLMLFNRVDRLEIQSVMLVFSTGFMNYCPSNLVST
jgi:hypothetical protein